ncbi:MAG TPA: bifunctional hydroxymethylpyrimidine kinase/phosphomethylpyrimidine kinase [Pyrinomonadaceae bacterium]|nr:bifunctional hydroxymethylpyrimidine kinase/phosphomethylpyrimidine kinase [Pyrinomonadaceae bacterium]
MHAKQPIALTIAGLDPSGGAGIIADVKTFVHFGARPAAAITSLTFQNSQRVFGAIHESAESLRAQVLPLLEEGRIAGLKIGMLPTADLVVEVARLLAETDLPAPVIDPVLQSSSGYELMEKEAVDALVTDLMPWARLLTPNIHEAEVLTGLEISDEAGMRQASAIIRAMGVPAVLVKGGHLSHQSGERPTHAIDILDNDGQVTVFSGEWIDSPPVRGTGCMLSSAIAACLARGISLEESVQAGKDFVAATIRHAGGVTSLPADAQSAAGN